ncbi:MAG: flagella basal body P-ring formation protein FlgA [Desulfotalea sp.]|nr:MAG: flagella basal body P-ring formation protein FlgA [Desulfotalea sp.]
MVRLLLILIFLVLSQPAQAFDVTFKSSGVVDGALVTLGDVATIGTMSEIGQSLLTVPIAHSPAPGEKAYLRTVNIKKYLASSQSLPEDIEWQGPSSVVVTRTGITIDAKRMFSFIADYLRTQQDSLPIAVIRFIPTSHPLPFTVATGALSCEVIPSNPGILSSSRFSLIFRIDDEVVKNMSIRGKIEARANIIATAIPVKKGTILAPRHLKETVMDISDLKEPGFDVSQFLGKRIKRSLRAGSPLNISMVETLPVIHKGEKVKIVIQSGAMTLTATGLARSDGKIDELIRVQNLNSKKVVFGKVVAPGIVEVIL